MATLVPAVVSAQSTAGPTEWLLEKLEDKEVAMPGLSVPSHITKFGPGQKHSRPHPLPPTQAHGTTPQDERPLLTLFLIQASCRQNVRLRAN